MRIPKKIKLANLPTPIEKVKYNGNLFLIKRDDYTGTELSGNKIRKLEYILHEAKQKKADYIFTCGGDQSNHCRATALAAAKLGIKSRLYLWGRKTGKLNGNLLLDNLAGAETRFLNYTDYVSVLDIMKSDSDLLFKKGGKAIVLPSGGTNSIGIWGYVNFINELKQQIDLSKIKGIMCANGSGGTAAGMLLGSALFGLNLKIFGVNVVGKKSEMNDVIFSVIDESLSRFKLDAKVNMDNLELLDGYSNEGYKNTASEKIELIKDFAANTGIILDPTYTGKAFYAYNDLFLTGSKRSNILFLHTGGLFGVFPKAFKFEQL